MTTTNEPPSDVVAALAALGFRAGRDALAAFFTHAHKSRLGPTEVGEGLVALERRAREALARARLICPDDSHVIEVRPVTWRWKP